MKIAVNTRFLLPNKLEGIGWFTYEVLIRWVAKHPEHEFLFLFDRAYDPQFIFGSNVCPLSVFPQARHPFLFYWWFEWSLPAVFARHKPDFFMSPDGFLSLNSNIPTQLVIHDIAWRHFPTHIPYLHRKHYEYFMPRFAQKAARIATVSEYSKGDIVQELGVEEQKIDVVYDGSNSAFVPIAEEEQNKVRQQYSRGQPYFLYVGSIHPRKNLARLLEAFDRFKEQSTAPHLLLVVGRIAWQSGDIGRIVGGLKYQNDVVFLGYTPTEELPRIMASAYSLTYVSLFEGFGIPILEAMNCDVPSITANTSSMPEVIGDAGLLADPYSVESISQALLQLYAQKELRQQFVERGRQQRQKFSWDMTADKMWESLMRLA